MPSSFGALIFDALTDCNRRIAAGVPIEDAADTMQADLEAEIAMAAVSEGVG